jgi:tetratricopeptide (TPR) repeat protein
VLGTGVKRSLWNVNMGLILDIFGFTGLAERRARDALELDPLDCRASNLVASRVDPEEGIDILKPVAERLESDKEWMKDNFNQIQFGKILFTLGKLYWKTDQTDLAVQVQTKALEVAFTDYGRVIEILSLYGDKKRWSDIIASLETIHQKSTESVQGLPELVIVSSSYARFHTIILQAALKTSQLELLEVMYEGAIKILLERQERTVLGYVRYFYATALHEQQDRESKAVAQWGLALKEDIPQSTSNTVLPFLITKLGPIYLQKARASETDTEAMSTWIHKIDTLLPEGVPEKAALFPPQIYLARYYQVQGEVIKAKQITRSVVELALEILSDDDEGNDIDAYLKLLSVFIPLGDEKNTLATLAMISSSWDKRSLFACNGDCRTSWDSSDEMWWCRDCITVVFCEKCYEKLHGDTLPFRICDKSHEFFHTPKWDSKMKETAKDCVPFGDSIIPFEQWKDEIRKSFADMNK